MVVFIAVAILVAVIGLLGLAACFFADFAAGLSLISDFFLIVIMVYPQSLLVSATSTYRAHYEN